VDARHLVDGQLVLLVGVALRQEVEAVGEADGDEATRIASIATALMTPLVPGAGPPPTRIPIRLMAMLERGP